MKHIINWEILDNEEACNSIAPLGVGNLGGETPIVLVGDRITCFKCRSCNRLAHTTASGCASRDKSYSSSSKVTLDEAMASPGFDMWEFEHVIELWNYDYGGS